MQSTDNILRHGFSIALFSWQPIRPFPSRALWVEGEDKDVSRGAQGFDISGAVQIDSSHLPLPHFIQYVRAR